MYWQDKLTKEWCKCRPDRYFIMDRTAICVDLKSTRSADSNFFSKDICDFHYDLQSYMYTNGIKECLGKKIDSCEFVFIVCEKEPPYMYNIFVVDDKILEKGEQDFRNFIGLHHECKESGNYYGPMGKYDTIQGITLPSYIIEKLKKKKENTNE